MTRCEEDIGVLGKTIYGEARGESVLGRAAVANVIMNRVARPGWWGRTVRGVCKKKWQFSCWNVNDPNLHVLKSVTKSNPTFRECLVVAELAYSGLLKDNTLRATHYFNSSHASPKWAEGELPCVVIGRHAFYNSIK